MQIRLMVFVNATSIEFANQTIKISKQYRHSVVFVSFTIDR